MKVSVNASINLRFVDFRKKLINLFYDIMNIFSFFKKSKINVIVFYS